MRANSQPPFTPAQFERYGRHLLLEGFGAEGQRALLASRVLLVGVGGLGCPAAQYLVAAGVGTLGLVDPDRVERSNLQRQILYSESDVGRRKVEAARARLTALNPDVQIETHAVQLVPQNAHSLIQGYDVVVDGSDNFPTRYAVSDACVALAVPNVYGSVLRFAAQMSVFDAQRGPCYRCLYPSPPPPGSVPACGEAGVLGVLPGLVAAIQATEVVKLLTGIGESLVGRLLQYDALALQFSEFRLERDPDCHGCGAGAVQREQPEVAVRCAREADPTKGKTGGVVFTEKPPVEIQALGVPGEQFLLLDVRGPDEHAAAHIKGSLLIPLGELPRRAGELEAWKDKLVVVHCHHGGRSAKACEWLAAQGFSRVVNLQGGIHAWSLTVDPAVPTY